MPQNRYVNAATISLNKYGSGPFCSFKIARGRRSAGLYIITSNDLPVYVGECINLEKHYNSNGYGGISPRNCYAGGQETNCRINNLILGDLKSMKQLALWFHEKEADKNQRIVIEQKLIELLKPQWNK